ncbi:MAG: glycerol-3-phosphate dehydrogenase C-terminal domain-containing protein, partial [Candidatus Binataceae bacterium]
MPAGIAPDLRESLAERYGTRQAIVARLIVERPALAEPLAPGCPVVGAEVIHAIRNELAVTLADFVVRRTAMVWRYPREAVVAAPRVAALIAEELGWDAARVATELASFRSALESARRAA